MTPPQILAHAGEIHAAQWLAIALGATVPLVAIVVVFILSGRR